MHELLELVFCAWLAIAIAFEAALYVVVMGSAVAMLAIPPCFLARMLWRDYVRN